MATPPPRLGVSHLLWWTAGCACYFAVMHAAAGDVSLRGMGFLVLQSLAVGPGIAAVLMVVANRCRRRPTVQIASPGGWLLIAMGVQFIVAAAMTSMQGRMSPTAPSIVATLAVAWVFLWPTFGRRLPLTWKITFGLLTIVWLAALVIFRDRGQFILLIETFLIVVAAAIVDADNWRRYDWQHAAGIAAWGWNLAVILLFHSIL